LIFPKIRSIRKQKNVSFTLLIDEQIISKKNQTIGEKAYRKGPEHFAKALSVCFRGGRAMITAVESFPTLYQKDHETVATAFPE
jgi:hypothetical protein